MGPRNNTASIKINTNKVHVWDGEASGLHGDPCFLVRRSKPAQPRSYSQASFVISVPKQLLLSLAKTRACKVRGTALYGPHTGRPVQMLEFWPTHTLPRHWVVLSSQTHTHQQAFPWEAKWSAYPASILSPELRKSSDWTNPWRFCTSPLGAWWKEALTCKGGHVPNTSYPSRTCTPQNFN